MKSFRTAVAVLATGLVYQGFGDLLLWQVSDPQIQYGYVTKSAEEAGANAVMVRGSNGETSDYVSFWYTNGDGNLVDKPAVKVQRLDSEWEAGPTWADMFGADGSGAGNGWSYVVELVNYNGGHWDVIANSETLSYSELASAGHVSPGELDFPGVTPWVPTFTATPEPTSAMLLLVGFGLLSLRRRHV